MRSKHKRKESQRWLYQRDRARQRFRPRRRHRRLPHRRRSRPWTDGATASAATSSGCMERAVHRPGGVAEDHQAEAGRDGADGEHHAEVPEVRSEGAGGGVERPDLVPLLRRGEGLRQHRARQLHAGAGVGGAELHRVHTGRQRDDPQEPGAVDVRQGRAARLRQVRADLSADRRTVRRGRERACDRALGADQVHERRRRGLLAEPAAPRAGGEGKGGRERRRAA